MNQNILNFTLTFTLSLFTPLLAEANNFPSPGPIPAGQFTQSGAVPSCQDKPRLLNYYQNIRQSARAGYAKQIAKFIPELKKGTKCIKSNNEEAIDARFVGGDIFAISCLAETRGQLTHLYSMELVAEIPACFSDLTLNNFINSAECQRPGAPENFLRNYLLSCNMQTGPLPKIRGNSSIHEIDSNYFARLINARPSVQNIVDSRNFQVKVGGRPSGGSSVDGTNCNAGGCLPGLSNSRDVK
jgi:hypothetical protein